MNSLFIQSEVLILPNEVFINLMNFFFLQSEVFILQRPLFIQSEVLFLQEEEEDTKMSCSKLFEPYKVALFLSILVATFFLLSFNSWSAKFIPRISSFVRSQDNDLSLLRKYFANRLKESRNSHSDLVANFKQTVQELSENNCTQANWTKKLSRMKSALPSNVLVSLYSKNSITLFYENIYQINSTELRKTFN